MVNRYYSTTAAQAQLTSNISSSATTINIDTTTGWPSSFPFTLIIDPGNSSEEVVECSGVAGLSATVIRGVDGSTGLAHTVGAKVQHGVSARDFAEPQAHMAASTGIHGLAGGVAVVGTSTTQTLTNKTIDGGSNTVTNLPDTSVPNWNIHKTTTDAHHEIDPHDVNSTALLIKALASQVADLEVWQDSTAAVLGYLGPDGTFGAGGGGAADLARFRVCGPTRVGDAASKATVNIKASSTTKPILRVDGTGQGVGGHLIAALAADGTSLSTLDKDGNLTITGTVNATNQATTLKSLTVNTTAAVTGAMTVTGLLHGAAKTCTSTTLPPNASALEGDLIYETDTDRLRFFDGSGWVLVGGRLPRVKTQRLTTQSIANLAFTNINWTSGDVYDADNLHDTSVSPELITVSETGVWHFDYSIGMGNSTAGARVAYLQPVTGGRAAYCELSASASGFTSLTGSADIYMTAADNIKLVVWQSSGGALNAAGDVNSYIAGHFVHP